MRFLKKMLRFLLWSLLFVYLAIALLPKESLFYQAERLLEPMKIYVNEADLSDRLLNFKLHEATILYQDVEAATIEGISLTTLLFYNRLSLTPFAIKEELAAFVPPKIATLSITQHILMPHKISIEAAGDFGTATGYVDLFERKLHIDIVFSSLVSRDYPALLKMVKHNAEGYYYEQAF